MGFWSFFVIFCFISFYVYWYSTTKALKFNSDVKKGQKLPSLPSYYGTHSFFWLFIPIFLLLVSWFFLKPFILDFFLLKKIPQDFLANFGGKPKMLIDTIKSTNPENFFPGTNPVIIDSVGSLHLYIENASGTSPPYRTVYSFLEYS